MPNSANVIPGLVHLSVELRDLDPHKLTSMMDDIRARARDIAANTGTTIAFRELARAAPAFATPDVQRAIEQAAAKLNLGSARLPSGAGHDAQMMALLGPMGMIFVPSVGGISHSPKELTDCCGDATVVRRVVANAETLRRPRCRILVSEFGVGAWCRSLVSSLVSELGVGASERS